MNRTRRTLLKGAASIAAVSALAEKADAAVAPEKKVHYPGPKPKETPLFSGAVSFPRIRLMFQLLCSFVSRSRMKTHPSPNPNSLPPQNSSPAF